MAKTLSTHPDADLLTEELHRSLEDPGLASINFLNEVVGQYPDAVSFASGAPTEEFFEVEKVHQYLRTFCDYLRAERGYPSEVVRRTIFQYGRTKGIISELIARNVASDEGIVVDPEAVVVTVGCQEAILLVLRALRTDSRSVLLAVSPTYVGLTGAASLLDLPVLPVSSGRLGVDLDDLVLKIRNARAEGLVPRACYVMPDFANPSGMSMSLATRCELLKIAEVENLLLLEDNPYGLFRNGSRRQLPTLKSLDNQRRVIYFGSFAKTVIPGARVGYVLADQRVEGKDGTVRLLADELSKIKSMVTVNTSPIAQAVVGGNLLENGCSLFAANEPSRRRYADNLNQLVAGLRRRFRRDRPGASGIEWSVPGGGFFVVVSLPFPADEELLELSASEYGVLWTPMRYFYGHEGGHNQVRLSASFVTSDQIELGLDRFARMVEDRAASGLGAHGERSAADCIVEAAGRCPESVERP